MSNLSDILGLINVLRLHGRCPLAPCNFVLLGVVEMRPQNKQTTAKTFSSKLLGIIYFLASGLNYDFCPSLNRYLYWLKQPIGWIVCAIFSSFLVGMFIGPQGFVLMWSFLCLLVLGAVWPLLSVKAISCRLSFSKQRSAEDEDTVAVLEITNHWPVPVFGLMIVGDFLQDQVLEGDDVAIGLQRIPGASVSTFKWIVQPEKRGVLPRMNPEIKNGFPFGIYNAATDVEIQGRTLIWPKSINLRGIPEVSGTQFNISGILSDRAGLDGDVIGVRNYRQGDSMRHIHWGKTAQLNRLIVQERQSFASRPFDVYLDLTPEAHLGGGSQGSYEWAIRIAGSVCRQLHDCQTHVGLICIGLPSEQLCRVSNQNGFNQLMDFLAMLPTFEELLLSDRKQAVRCLKFDKNRKSFLISTTKSHDFHESNQVQQIVIDSSRFVSSEALIVPQASSSPAETIQSSKRKILIASPSSVVSDLNVGWENGVGCGS
jgi:uncharacterized protein (DUF58 family)